MAFREFGPIRALAQALAPSFTVYAFDRRGRGESTDTPPYAVEREIEDLAALIETAGGSAFVYGFSSGAVLSLCAAASLGPAIPKLALLEPPIELEGQPDTAFAAGLNERISAGRMADAAEFFNRSSLPGEWHGVAPEVLAPALIDFFRGNA